MIFRIKSQAPVTLETIAFADVVINLFIFFFVTFGLFATFDLSSKGTLPIELPRAEHASAAEKKSDPLILMIDRSGHLYLEGQRVARRHLRDAINNELFLRKEKSITVRADRKIPLEQFVSALDVVRNTKAKAVAVETET